MARLNQVSDLKEFAIKVERLCEFLLNKVEQKDDSADIRIIQDLKDWAADIHMTANLSELYGELLFEGLDSHMKGVPNAAGSSGSSERSR